MDNNTLRQVLLEGVAQAAGDVYDHFTGLGYEPRDAALETSRQVVRIYSEEVERMLRFLFPADRDL